ncbi:DUF2834 domain-containing protein [Cyanobium sp. CH-040]|uniref:DUF2834 domain-containing protein n=1 Tax=Cyanobium sp. CH-040 TaxID=2823708 RepID=UPI0028F44F86|nr:DUF2834 domain-containing protein [Cyanobium sp. CH-040]MCP9927223.1 DUF2834 domain-containing protein [Cyanobium sp. CH-040]
MSPTPQPSITPEPLQQGGEHHSAWLQWVYLALAIAGAVLPWLANIAFIHQYGSAGDLGLFLRLASANPAAESLSRDLAIGATAVLIWIVHEGRRLQMRGLPWVLLSCFTLAFACGAPLFLYLRERRLAELRRQADDSPTRAQGD